MCLAKAFMTKNGADELLAEEITDIRAEGEKLLVTTLFGEKRELDARIKEVDFRGSRVLLEQR